MSGRRDEIRRRIMEVVEKFREKGALSPEKAMTIQELNLPPRFEEAMHRRLGQTGIFVEVNGKYYLNEERLRQIQEQRIKKGSESSGSNGWGKTKISATPTAMPATVNPVLSLRLARSRHAIVNKDQQFASH